MDEIDLNTMCLLAREREYSALTDCLVATHVPVGEAFYHGASEHFYSTVGRLNACLEDAPLYKHLFELRQLSGYLLSPREAPDWAESWLAAQVPFDRYFPEMDIRTAVEGTWATVPVVTVLADACIGYYIAGMVPGATAGAWWPPWADPLLDDVAKTSILSAAAAAARLAPVPPNHQLICYPLTLATGTVQFQGPSLGLPLALAFMSVLNGGSLPRRLLASGAVTENGMITPVGHLKKKVDCARYKGFNAFLLPNLELPTFAHKQDFEILPVADLAEAWMIASLYAPGRGRELLTLADMLRAPNAFVAHMDHVGAKWIQWVRRQGKTDGVVARIAEDPDLFGRFTAQTERMLENWNLDAAATFLGLFSPQMFEKARGIFPLTAFKCCTLNLALANHRGDVDTAEKWTAEGFRLFANALPADINACADFLNNTFVSLHNRYRFAPEWPDELQRVLSCLERRHAVQCDAGCVTDPVLARLYGTLAQNFAFCGPEHLSLCEQYAHWAMAAFGNNRVPELRDHFRRQFGYLVYARLDAGHIASARQALLDYLEAESWADLWRRCLEKDLTAWHHAVLARFLADTDFPVEKEIYFNLATGLAESPVRKDHPWQLWAFNMGRIAGELGNTNRAAVMYKKSLDLCLADAFGPTVRMMALLPLMELHALDRLKTEEAAAVHRQIRHSAKMINSSFFQFLFQPGDLADHLNEVAKHPQSYFPFSYR